jgi:small-conductance mechanosensitive channel
VCKTPAPFAVLDELGEKTLVFTLYFWVELVKGTNAAVVASDLRLMIDKRLTETTGGPPNPPPDTAPIITENDEP